MHVPRPCGGYWTDPERMCEWWGAAAELDPRPGGICRVDSRSGGIMRGEFVELVPYERLVFTFGWEPTEGAPAVPPARRGSRSGSSPTPATRS